MDLGYPVTNRISPFWILLELRVMEVVITAGATRRAKLQSKCHIQQTNTQFLQAGCPSSHPKPQKCVFLVWGLINLLHPMSEHWTQTWSAQQNESERKTNLTARSTSKNMYSLQIRAQCLLVSELTARSNHALSWCVTPVSTSANHT